MFPANNCSFYLKLARKHGVNRLKKLTYNRSITAIFAFSYRASAASLEISYSAVTETKSDTFA
jgi:hypothetical protein